MKILLLFSNLAVGFCSAFGQNYVGLSQAKILRNFGDPDERGTNYFVYYDEDEKGQNTYYFDENHNCNAFVISRSMKYLDGYQRMLENDFRKLSDDLYIYTSKHRNFKADIVKFSLDFELRITPLEQNMSPYILNDTLYYTLK